MSDQVATRRQALTADGLSLLGPQLVRKLCQMLIVERGSRITRVQPRNQQDDIHILTEGLWRRRAGLVRVVHRQLEAEDIELLAELARTEPLAEAVLIEGSSGDGDLPGDSGVYIIRASELVARIRASALVEWENGQPRPAQGRFELAADLDQIAAALDPVGLRWLPTLALNQVPPELEGAGSADELLERIAFRILTTALRFGGRRLGAQQRGRRLPDSVLRWQGNAALLDCKAAQYGYRMDIGDQRALVEYFRRMKSEEEEAGFSLNYIVVLSAEFDGEPGSNHPFYGRAQAIEEESGAKLVYLRAADLVRLVIEIESEEADPDAREAIAWSELFDVGMPRSEQVLALWRQEQ